MRFFNQLFQAVKMLQLCGVLPVKLRIPMEGLLVFATGSDTHGIRFHMYAWANTFMLQSLDCILAETPPSSPPSFLPPSFAFALSSRALWKNEVLPDESPRTVHRWVSRYTRTPVQITIHEQAPVKQLYHSIAMLWE